MFVLALKQKFCSNNIIYYSGAYHIAASESEFQTRLYDKIVSNFIILLAFNHYFTTHSFRM